MNVTTPFCFCFHFMLRIMFNSYNECLPYNSISENVGLGNTSIRSVQDSRRIVKLVSHLTLLPPFVPLLCHKLLKPQRSTRSYPGQGSNPFTAFSQLL
jgi:hypothetical protein